jgi:hypothetical protein
MTRMPAVRAARIALCGAVALALAASTSTAYGSARGDTRASRHAHGMVKGKLVREDGPTPPGAGQPPETPVSGLVRFTAVNRRLVVKVRVGYRGSFRTSLPSGRYHVVGRSPGLEPEGQHDAWCSLPMTVTVHPRRTAKITLICPAP